MPKRPVLVLLVLVLLLVLPLLVLLVPVLAPKPVQQQLLLLLRRRRRRRRSNYDAVVIARFHPKVETASHLPTFPPLPRWMFCDDTLPEGAKTARLDQEPRAPAT